MLSNQQLLTRLTDILALHRHGYYDRANAEDAMTEAVSMYERHERNTDQG